MSDTRISVFIDGHNAGLKRALASSSADLRRFRTEQNAGARSTRQNAIEQRNLNLELRNQSRQLSALSLQYIGLRSALLTLGIRTAVTGFAALTSEAAALGGGLTMVASSAGAAGTALATVGTSSLTALVQGMSVAKLATAGLGDALTTTGQAHERAMDKLSKPARQMARDLGDLRDGYRELQLLSQKGMFPGMLSGFNQAKVAGDEVKQVVYDTAQAMGYLADHAGGVIAKRQTDLLRLGERNVVSIRRYGIAAMNAGEALVDTLRAADPLIGHVTAGVVTLSERMRDAAAEGRKDGSLASTFFELRKFWDETTAISGNIGGTIIGTMRAGVEPTHRLNDALKETTQSYQDFVNSDTGRSQIRDFLDGNVDVLEATGGLLESVMRGLTRFSIAGHDNMLDFIDVLEKDLGPVISDLVLSLNGDFFPVLLGFISSFSELADAVIPGLEPIGQVVGDIASVTATIIGQISTMVEGTPTLAKIPAALMLGGLVLGGWAKMRLAIRLAVLEMRRFLGLARDIPVIRPGMQQLLSQGGRVDRTEGTNGAAPMFGVGGRGGGTPRPFSTGSYTGGSAARTSVQPDRGRAPGGYGNPNRYTLYDRGSLRPAYQDGMGRITPQGGYQPIVNPVTSQTRVAPIPIRQNGRVTGYRDPFTGARMSAQAAAAANARGGVAPIPFNRTSPVPGRAGTVRLSGQLPPFSQPAPRVTRTGMAPVGPIMDPRTGRPLQTREAGSARARYQAGLAPDATPLTRAQRAGMATGDLASSTARGVSNGVRQGMKASAPVMKMAFGVAAFSGIIGGLASNEKTISNKLQDAFSAATFGLVETAGEKRDQRGARVSTALARTIAQPGGKRVFDTAPVSMTGIGKLDEGLRKAAPKFNLDTRKGVQGFREYNAALVRNGTITAEVGEANRKMAGQIGKAIDGVGEKAAKLPGVLTKGFDFSSPKAQVVDAGEALKRALDDAASSGGKSLSRIRGDMAIASRQIHSTLGAETEQGKNALAANFRAAADAVKASMDAGLISVKTGTAEIRKLMISSLEEVFGGDRKAARAYLDKKETNGKPTAGEKGTNPRAGAAGGKLMKVGGTQAAGVDSVAAHVGGQRLMVAPGEDVAVINRHQRSYLDKRLAAEGGLRGVFSGIRTKHNESVGMASGGLLGLAGGGMVRVPGDPNDTGGRDLVSAAIAQQVGAWVQRYHANVGYAYDPGHHQSAGHNVTGTATDVYPGPGGDWDLLEKGLRAVIASGRTVLYGTNGVGQPYPNHGRGNHAHIEWGASGAAVGGPSAGAAGDLGASLGGAAAPKLKEVLSGLGGSLGGVADAALSRVKDAAQSVIDKAAGSGGVTGGGLTSAGGSWDKAALKELWTKHGGPAEVANIAAAIALAESAGNANARNSIGATGLWQIYNGPGTSMSLLDPDLNAAAAVAKYRAAHGFSPWTTYTGADTPGHEKTYLRYLAEGGLLDGDVRYAAAGVPPREQGVPNVNTDDAVTGRHPASSAKKKKKKAPKKKVNAPGRPQLSRIKANAKKKSTKSKYSPSKGLLKYEKLPELGLLDYESVFATPADTAAQLAQNMEASFNLSDESATVTLFDSDRYKDLSLYLQAHPELARYVIDPSSESLEVVNTNGLSVQGKWTPGIGQHNEELHQLLERHTGHRDGQGVTPSSILGILSGYAGHLGSKGIPLVQADQKKAAERTAWLEFMWTQRHEHHASQDAERRQLVKGKTWEDRVATNNARVRTLRDYLSKIADKTVTGDVVLSGQAKKDRKWANDQIRELGEDSADLKASQPGPTFQEPAKKNESDKEKKARQARNKARRAKYSKLSDGMAQDRSEMRFINDSTDNLKNMGGIRGTWDQRRLDDVDRLKDLGQTLTTLTTATIPGEQLTIAGMLKELGAWSDTNIPYVLPTTGPSADDAAKVALQEQINDELRRTLATQTAQFGVLSGTQQMVDARIVGAYAHGGVIPETGMALVHQNETIIPDPEGPYANRAAMAQMMKAGGGGGTSNVQLVFAAELAPLVRLIDQRIEGKAPAVVSKVIGGRSRLLGAAPGGS